MTRDPIHRQRVMQWTDGKKTIKDDAVVVEEPLDIRVRHGPLGSQLETSIGLTMRTPGNDFELAAGLLVSEGIVHERRDLVHITHCRSEEERDYGNAVLAELRPDFPYRPQDHERSYLRTAACGVCGRASLETLAKRIKPVLPHDFPATILGALPQRLRKSQSNFEATGGIHAAALFGPDGNLELVHEDVGRHNAVDKVVGDAFLKGRLPLGGRLLLVSGRAGYEIVQKAASAGVSTVASIGAPSSLAIELARTFGVTLIGFLRTTGHNVYTGPQMEPSSRVT